MTPSEDVGTSTQRERSIPVLETKRLTLRAPRHEDVKAITVLANDRRIAENTTRIPHPYRLADAEE
jgi:RimJ/RimL family protein N-acetyltransferase